MIAGAKTMAKTAMDGFGMGGAIVKSRFAAYAAALAGVFGASVGLAQTGEPKDWQLGFQEPASLTMERIDVFHDFVTIISVVIMVFVVALLLIVIFKFNERANPTPTTTTHNMLLEVLWTAGPVLILIIIAVPSFKLLYYADRVENPEMTLKITGNQWYWSYEYPDYGNFGFDANMVTDEDIAKNPKLKRLMDTDNRVVLPVGKRIQLLMTSNDVIHNWGIPAFGVKLDTVPGRLNETWVQITKPGVYYGFCSELCGVNHSYMPVTIEAVSPEDFAIWVKAAQKKYARKDAPAQPLLQLAKNKAAD
jgi:cytochrome c oxidase subunit 2